jgi:hypothetical protein
MKRILSLTAAAALVFTTVASAQLLNYPVNVNPHHGNGVGIAGLFGKGLNDNSGKNTSFGAGARIGFGMINIAAGGMTNNFEPESKIDFAANAEFVAIKGGASPFAASIFAGFGFASDIGTTIPLGVGLSVAPPMASAMLSIWAAPFYGIFTPDSDICSDCSSKDFGVSGGVRLGLPMGLGFGVSVQWVNVESFAPITLGASVGWKFATAG